MSWRSGPWEPTRVHPAVRRRDDTTAGRSAVPSELGDTKHSLQHMFRYQTAQQLHVRSEITAGRVEKPISTNAGGRQRAFGLSTADGAS